MVQYALDQLLKDKATIRTSLPAQGIVTLAKQKNRYVVHLLYGVPVKRGKNTEVIEDIQPLYELEVQLNSMEKIKRIYLAPGEFELDYTQEKGNVGFKVPKLELHQMIVAEY